MFIYHCLFALVLKSPNGEWPITYTFTFTRITTVNLLQVNKRLSVSTNTQLLVYLNGNNAAEGENNNKYANSYSMHELNSEELICTRHI